MKARAKTSCAGEGGRVAQADLIKRFTKTPFETRLGLSGTSIRVETNCQVVADRLRQVLMPCTASDLDTPDFVLRLVAESEDELDFETAAVPTRLSYDGLSFISLGQKSFLACDRRTRQGICFIPENLVTDEKWFNQHFLQVLISMLKDSIEASS